METKIDSLTIPNEEHSLESIRKRNFKKVTEAVEKNSCMKKVNRNMYYTFAVQIWYTCSTSIIYNDYYYYINHYNND